MHSEPLAYAGFWKRLNAYGWDSLVILGLSLLVYVTPAFATDATAEQIRALVDAGLLPAGTTTENITTVGLAPLLSQMNIGIRDFLMPIVLSAVYNISFVAGDWQATPGKRLVGIKVVMRDGSRPTLLDAINRHLCSGVSVFLCYLGYLFIFWTKEKTALHDMMCHTRVVIGKTTEA